MKMNNQNKMRPKVKKYDKNSFYFNTSENLWCWKQTSTEKIFKASTKTELLKIKEKQFIGSGNYEREPREYRLDEGQISTEEFGNMTGLGTKQYISLLLIRGTTPISNYEKNSGGDGVHKPEGRRKKGLHFVKCLERSKINYDKVLNQYNTKVWVFKNINKEKIDNFKRLWVEK